MTGWWRTAYWMLGIEYPDRWDERQRQLKYQVVLQIQKSKLQLKPSSKVNKDEVVKNVVGNRKVRISDKIEDIPPVPPSSPNESYATLKDLHYKDTVTELKTLFKNKRKKSFNNKKSWKRKHAL